MKSKSAPTTPFTPCLNSFVISGCCPPAAMQIKQQLHTLQAAASSAEQLQHLLAQQQRQLDQLQQHNLKLQGQLANQHQNTEQALQDADSLRKGLQQQLLEANQRHNQQVQQHK